MKPSVRKFAILSISMALTSFVITSCDKDDDDDYEFPETPVNVTTFIAKGDSASIVEKLNAFRNSAGATLNTAPGAVGGRREVNWDGVPGDQTNITGFAVDFFGASDPALPNGRKRGLITNGTTFRVDSTDFSEIDPSYKNQFEAFSRKRLFNYMGNIVSTVTFKVPGTNQNAFINSFAVIFSDVDQPNTSKVEFFNGSKSLGIVFAQPAAQGFSLVGATFPDDKITSVKITSGTGLLGTGVKDISDGGASDLVVMDDFLYNEPKGSE